MSWFVKDEWWKNSRYDDIPVKRLTLARDVDEPKVERNRWNTMAHHVLHGYYNWQEIIMEALAKFEHFDIDSIGLLAGDDSAEGARILREMLKDYTFVLPGKVQYTCKDIPTQALEHVYCDVFWNDEPYLIRKLKRQNRKELQEVNTLLL